MKKTNCLDAYKRRDEIFERVRDMSSDIFLDINDIINNSRVMKEVLELRETTWSVSGGELWIAVINKVVKYEFTNR
jgi:hypothetical protein